MPKEGDELQPGYALDEDRQMNYQLLDSTGTRIKWARQQCSLNQHELADAVGVHNVYISQLESNARTAGRHTMKKIAVTLGVTLGFLEMETDEPTPIKAEQPEASIYLTPQAGEAARLVDAMPDSLRAVALDVVRAIATYANGDCANHFSDQAKHAAELIDGVPPDKREEMLDVIQVMAKAVSQDGCK